MFPRGIVENGGIHVTASSDISIVAFSNTQFISDSFLCLPTDALGTDYLLMAYPGTTIDGGGTEFAVVGTEDGTTVTITLSANATTYSAGSAGVNAGTPITRLAGITFSVTLNAGETYHSRNSEYAPVDFTGTRVVSSKPVAVMSGHILSRVPLAFGGANFLMEELPPTSSWGTRFVTGPLAKRRNGDSLRFLALTNNTTIRLNGGVVAVLQAGEVHQLLAGGPADISASGPILLAQLSNGSDYDGEFGDPFMMWVPSVDQFAANYTVMVPTSYWPTNGFPTNYLHLVVPTNATSSIQLDGAVVAASAFSPLGNSGFAGASLLVARGAHRVTGGAPFGLWVYGFASFDAYGHPAGAVLSEGAYATQLSLAPQHEVIPAGSTASVVATVAGQDNRPLAGVCVEFTVLGSNPTNGFAFTDAAGQAAFSCLAANPGGDFIFAQVGDRLTSASCTVLGNVAAALTGSVADDGLPTGAPVTASWSQVSGPGPVTFSSTNAANTYAYFTAAGTYVLRFTASDSSLASFDDLTVSVATNSPPTANAGPDHSVVIPNDITLTGTASDDALPPGSTPVLTWTKVVGPGLVTFSQPTTTNSQLTTSASFSGPGTYILRLTATDGEASASDELVVTVRRPNNTPVVDPGPPQVLFLPNKLRLHGQVSDDGQPTGSALSFNWSMLSGPAAVTFMTGTNSLDAIVSFTSGGSYVFRLTASDTDLSTSADVTVFVSSSSNERPTANAGQDQTITFAERALLVGKVSDDGGTTGAVRTFWSKISGPGTVTFGQSAGGTQNRVNTASFSVAGTYVLRLQAFDDLIGTNDDLTITFNPGTNTAPSYASNLAPSVNAGADASIALSDVLPLNVTAFDDGLPGGYPVAGWWLKVSGPGKVIFGDSSSFSTTARFGAAGTYVLRFTASDFASYSTDDVTVTVAAATNLAPVVNAGSDQVIGHNTATLHGSFADDELPANGSPAVTWSKLSGPFAASFATSSALDTSVTFNGSGTYVLRLSVTDGALTGTDDVTILYETNQPPVVTLGVTSTNVVLGHSLEMRGTLTDDGRPTDAEMEVTWTKLSGPGAVSITPPGGFFDGTNAVASAMFSTNGTYVLRLSAYDGKDRTQKDMTVFVTVNPNQPPLVDAGPDQTITLPAATLTYSASDDGAPSGTLTVQWSVLTGLGTVTFSQPTTNNNQFTRTASFSVAGTYVLRLSASDGELTVTDDVTITVNPPNYNNPPPLAELTAPIDGAIITTPTPVVGTASSAALERYELQYRLAGENSLAPTGGEGQDEGAAWTTFASGTTSVTSATLGTFDPTLVLNGIYELRLVVTDVQGQSAITPSIPVVVEGNLKIGAFTLSFSDLTILLAGIPIEIIRTYDSRDKRHGDFGVGWTLDVKNVRLQKQRSIGRNWSGFGAAGTYCLDSSLTRSVTVTLGDNRVFRFDPVLSPECQYFLPIESVLVNFTNRSTRAGTQGRLEIIGDNHPNTDGFIGTVNLINIQDFSYFNPTLFKLTTLEGEEYVIDELEGLKSMTDRNGNTLTIATNGIIHSSGQSISFVRDPEGRIQEIIDPAGKKLFYGYNVAGSLASFTDRVTNTTAFAYTNAAFPYYLTGITDPRGVQAIRNQYDDSGRLVRQIDASGHTNVFTHEMLFNREIICDRLGNLTVHEYDANGNVVRTTDALNNVTRYEYDANDNLLAKIDALGNTTRFTYDGHNNKLTETDPLGFTTLYTYDAFRQVTSIMNPRGFITTNTYDPDTGNLTEMRDPLGNATRFIYDSQGNILTLTDVLGNVISNRYDSFGHMTNRVVIDAQCGMLNETWFGYDASGNQTSKTTKRTTASSVETLVTGYVYDSENRLTHTIHPDGATNQTMYVLGRDKPAIEIDPLGRQKFHYYDERGNLTNTVCADLTSESFGYDAENRKISLTDRAGRSTLHVNDALGRLTTTTYPDGSTTTNFFDSVGRMLAVSDALGQTTFYGYDAAGRRTSATNALGQVTRQLYDEAGNLTHVIDALGRTNIFLYDQSDRRWGMIFPDGTISTTYFDSLGRRVAETDQSTNTTWFGYDAAGRLTSVTNALGFVTRYEYNEQGQQTAQIDANNHVTAFEYDSLGRRTKRTLPGGQFETYAYNVAGLLTNRTDFNGYSTAFFYDPLNRFLEKRPDSRRGEPSITYAYDAEGLRTNMTDISGVTSYRYDDRNRLIEKTKTWGRTAASPSLTMMFHPVQTGRT